jgi:hypothetical protein
MVPGGPALTPLRGCVLRDRIKPHGWRRGLRSYAPPGLPVLPLVVRTLLRRDAPLGPAAVVGERGAAVQLSPPR